MEETEEMGEGVVQVNDIQSWFEYLLQLAIIGFESGRCGREVRGGSV